MIDYNPLFHIDHVHSLSLLNPANLSQLRDCINTLVDPIFPYKIFFFPLAGCKLRALCWFAFKFFWFKLLYTTSISSTTMVELQLISNKSMGSKSGTPSKRKGHCFTRKCSSLVKEQRARIYVLVGVVCLICSVGSSANDGSPVLFVTSFLVNFCTCKAHICLACLAGLDTRGVQFVAC